MASKNALRAGTVIWDVTFKNGLSSQSFWIAGGKPETAIRRAWKLVRGPGGMLGSPIKLEKVELAGTVDG